MRAYKVSKESNLLLEEKIKLITDTYDVEDLLYVLREFEDNPRNYEKEVVTSVINKLFENGITCI